MNCKQGDLVIIRRPKMPANLGKIFRCIARYDGPWRDNGKEPGWVLDRPVERSCGKAWPQMADCNLRPLRDDDGEDEMLCIAGLPVVLVAG